MAIAVSIVFSLIAGVTAMYNNKYFWGKEDNPNICAMNTSINNFNSVFDFTAVAVVVIVALGAIMFLCTTRGF